MPKKVLVIAAHPDDEVLGCGGTMARHAASGDEVSLLILGEGLTSRQQKRNAEELKSELRDLQECTRASAKILGVHQVLFEALPDNRFDSLDLIEVVKRIEAAKGKVRPDLVYTHHSGDLNVDHRITHEAVLTAFRPQPDEKAGALYAFEVASSTEWQGPGSKQPFLPNHFVEITPFLKKKLEALSCYEWELRPFPHPRSLKAVENAAITAGAQIGLVAAERFITIRAILRSN